VSRNFSTGLIFCLSAGAAVLIWYAIEKLNLAGFQAVFSGNYQQVVFLGHSFERGGAVFKRVSGNTRVGAHCLFHELVFFYIEIQ
jgi:hypothetical protein